jgi:hypothetical protein
LEQALSQPLANFGRLGAFAARQVGAIFSSPTVPLRSAALENDAARLGKLIGAFGRHVQRLLAKYREEILDRQYHLSRIAEAATELYVGSCVLARLDAVCLDHAAGDAARADALARGRYYLAMAARRIRDNLAALWDNDDDEATRLADRVLRRGGGA